MSTRFSMLVRVLSVCLLTLFSLATRPAEAASVEQAIADIGSAEFERVRAAIAELALSDDPRALAVLNALDKGELRFDAAHHAFLVTDAATVDAASGVPSTPKDEPVAPRVNNAIRRVLAPALAQLRLQSKDSTMRLEAATELAKRPTELLREPMVAALDRETDSNVKQQLRLAVAQVDLWSSDRQRRLDALKMLGEDGDVTHTADLERLMATDASGAFTEPDSEIRDAARGALSSIESRFALIGLVANTFYGLSLGSILLLAALGLAITFGLMRVINMAHGEMLMIGAYTTFVVQGLFTRFASDAQDYYLVAAVPAAFVVTGLVGLALERGVVRHLYGRPLETLLATWGISLVLIQTVRLIFGAQNVTVANPSWLSGGWELMPTVVLPYSRLAIIAFTFVVVSFVWFLLRRTRLGLYVRAVTQNRAMANNLGIPSQRIDMWTFSLGSAVAGLGGVALSQVGNVGPELGQGYIVDSFMVVVLGGVGNVIGAVVGALGLGVLNKFLEPIAGAVLGKIFVLVLIILFIQKRPQGLFALKGRAAEL